jgi:23S rRNA pseudouridine1911/1915/1917 synthase
VALGGSRQSRRVCWVVREPGERLGSVLQALGASPQQAIDEGRVFVRGRRARQAGERLSAGDRVEVFATRVADERAWVVDERGGLVAAYKPARIPTEADHTGRSESLVQQVATELGARPESLHALGRLDAGVSGVVLVAVSRAARLIALRARAEGRLERRYVALASRVPEPPQGSWNAPLAPPVRGRRRGLADPRGASTAYGHVSAACRGRESAALRWPGAVPAMIALEPRTGRSHQLRAHAAQAGLPLLGDRAYGGPVALVEVTGTSLKLDRIALHAFRLRLRDGSGETWEVVAPPPVDLRAWWHKLGGDEGAWSASLEIAL